MEKHINSLSRRYGYSTFLLYTPNYNQIYMYLLPNYQLPIYPKHKRFTKQNMKRPSQFSFLSGCTKLGYFQVAKNQPKLLTFLPMNMCRVFMQFIGNIISDDGKLYTGGNKSTLLFGPTLEQGKYASNISIHNRAPRIRLIHMYLCTLSTICTCVHCTLYVPVYTVHLICCSSTTVIWCNLCSFRYSV